MLSHKHKLGKGIKLDSSPRPEFFHTAVVFDTGILRIYQTVTPMGCVAVGRMAPVLCREVRAGQVRVSPACCRFSRC